MPFEQWKSIKTTILTREEKNFLDQARINNIIITFTAYCLNRKLAPNQGNEEKTANLIIKI